MKLTGMILVLACVFFVVVGGYFFIRDLQENPEDTSDDLMNIFNRDDAVNGPSLELINYEVSTDVAKLYDKALDITYEVRKFSKKLIESNETGHRFYVNIKDKTYEILGEIVDEITDRTGQ